LFVKIASLWIIQQYKRMMLGKKPGPPVPPRPSASAVALARTTSPPSSLKPTVQNGGRTIIYKSPSFENKKAKNQNNNIKVNMVTCDNSNDSLCDEKIQITSDVIKNGNETRKTEIFIDNENNKNIVNDCSPVPKPRTHHQLKLKSAAAAAAATTTNGGVVGIEKPPTVTQSTTDLSFYGTQMTNKTIELNNNCHDLTSLPPSLPSSMPPQSLRKLSTSSIIIKAPVAVSSNASPVVGDADEINNFHSKNGIELKNNKKNQNYNNFIGNNHHNQPKLGLVDEKNDRENCNNNKKLMTEILIEKSNRNFRMPLIETKNLNAFKKFASENNLHTPIALKAVGNLPSRPEPEGGERDSEGMEKRNGLAGDKVTGKRVAFHEMLISELTEMRNKEHLVLQKYPRHGSEKNLTDISPNGTTRARIRTSDWIEVSDTGKQEVFTSCQISLEDSGMEDEEKLDDASSGVGDSWDSTKDAEER
jgi:hypothetical protein